MLDLPLFPLNVVLFPGMRLPLHIFEDRYKAMINECLERRSPFGVLLVRPEEDAGTGARSYRVGTTAVITNVERLEDGRLNLVTVGVQRFRVLDVALDRGYLTGTVETLEASPDDAGQVAAEAERVGALFGEYYRLYLALGDQWQRTAAMPSDPSELADFVGASTDVDLQVKQDLLETVSVLHRLRKESGILGAAIREMTLRVEAHRMRRWAGLGVLN